MPGVAAPVGDAMKQIQHRGRANLVVVQHLGDVEAGDVERLVAYTPIMVR